jgi:hypothetical protein
MIQIELSDTEAELFIRFREYQDVFQVMIEKEVFKVKAGKAILHFNGSNKLIMITIDHKI